MNQNNRLLLVGFVSSLTLVAMPALAHVVVKPSQVGVDAFQTFTVGVPTEKDLPTVAVRLVLPDGLQEVIPNAKPGWTIKVKKNGTGDDAPVTEIDWTGGTVPVGQRDEFAFNAQVPASPTTLQWKAYQTYQDGSVVSWDQTPNGSDDATGDKGPYSTTDIINDLTVSPAVTSPTQAVSAPSDSKPLVLSVIALIIALVGVGLSLRKK